MGLDAIEITQPLEEAFGIQIEADEIAQISTPGELVDLIMTKVQHAEPEQCLTLRAFNLLRAALLRQVVINRRDISPKAFLAELVPKADRKVLWEILSEELGVGPLPGLVRPEWLGNLLIACSLLIGIVGSVLQGLQPSSTPFFIFLTSAAAGIVTAIIGYFATVSFCTEFPSRIRTVGDLSQWIVAHKPDVARCAPGKWTREQVAARVRDVVIENLDCRANYRENASFVDDLGSEDG